MQGEVDQEYSDPIILGQKNHSSSDEIRKWRPKMKILVKIFYSLFI